MRHLSQRLYVCWGSPTPAPGAEDAVLSFLSPVAETALTSRWTGRLIRAREASRSIRADARALYLELVAQIGIAHPYGDSRTFRQQLGPPGQASQWWYHPVTSRDCEDQPIFDRIIAVLTIASVANQLGLRQLVVVGAPQDVAALLRQRFTLQEQRTVSSGGVWRMLLRGVGSRLRYLSRAMRRWRSLQREGNRLPAGRVDVALSGFWDWSVWCETTQGRLVDRYFQRLPDELAQRGLSIGWFAWFDPSGDPGKAARRDRDVLSPLAARRDVVMLQSLLRPFEIIAAVADYSPLASFLAIRRKDAFARAFQQGGFHWYPLFAKQLLRGFLDASLPHHELVALATQRACQRYQPKVTMSFLEHASYSRAHYEGVRRAGSATTCYAVQHASYNREKTFLCLHPSIELKGEPDGCAVPHPDYVCAMGALGQRLFLDCGYAADRVLLTGSPRYDGGASPRPMRSGNGITERLNGSSSSHQRSVSILVAAGLNAQLELEMVEALCAAAQDIPGVALRLRSHPFCRIDRQKGFAPYRHRLTVTRGPLEEDLAQADIVLCTYSTVAEQAFVLGKPVWQWLPLGFNGSALAEAATIPQFGSVAELRDALRAFQEDPGGFLPTAEARQHVLQQLFYQQDGRSAQRVSEAVVRVLAESSS